MAWVLEISNVITPLKLSSAKRVVPLKVISIKFTSSVSTYCESIVAVLARVPPEAV